MDVLLRPRDVLEGQVETRCAAVRDAVVAQVRGKLAAEAASGFEVAMS